MSIRPVHKPRVRRVLTLGCGPLLAAIAMATLPDAYTATGMTAVPLSDPARLALALGLWMAAWWLTEAVPLSATALLPLIVLPLFGGEPASVTAGGYAHPLIFLFLGGFLLSRAIEKWGLHEWIARRVLARSAGSPRRLIGGFMLVTAFASMWLSNTATSIMMLPIALSAVRELALDDPRAGDEVASRLLLAIAYSASIGGMATLIGSPPNLFVAGFLEERTGVGIDFRTWLIAALPAAMCLLPLTWWWLTRDMAHHTVNAAHATIPVTGSWENLPVPTRRVAWIFLCTVAAWIFRSNLNEMTVGGMTPLAGLSDTGIALMAGLALFVIPSGCDAAERLLQAQDFARLPLDTLLLFGGGLALAAALSRSGADQFLGGALAGLPGLPAWGFLLLLIGGIVFLTELTSNIATTTALAPVLVAAALPLGLPAGTIGVVTALAASAAFMLPVATPPNAIVYGSGRVRAATMRRNGLMINLFSVAVLFATSSWWLPRVLT